MRGRKERRGREAQAERKGRKREEKREKRGRKREEKRVDTDVGKVYTQMAKRGKEREMD